MEHSYKDPYNFTYFVGFIFALLFATLPASLTCIRILTQ